MKKDEWKEALGLMKDEHIMEAANYKRKSLWAPLSAIAAVLAVAILVGIVWQPGGPSHMQNGTTGGTQASMPSTGNGTNGTTAPVPSTGVVVPPVLMAEPLSLVADYSTHQPVSSRGLAQQLQDFFGRSMAATLGQKQGENKAYSPANLYMALSLLAELTGGEAELMSLLGAKDLNMLRETANKLWSSTYLDGEDKILLANSLWLENGVSYNRDVLEMLSQNYYNSAFSGDLGSQEVNQAIAQWINEQTGDLLKEEAAKIQLDPETVFALYSTLYYQVQWRDEFHEGRNIQAAFHGTTEATVTYMRKTEVTAFYRGSNFTAICTGLKYGGMWLILPDEGVAPETLLESREYLDLVLDINVERPASVKVHLQLPKFDIQTSGSLVGDIQSLGVSRIFNSMEGCFEGFLETDVDGGVYVKKIDQATRVCVDEKGVTAANYVGVEAPGDSVPPEEEVDFILDRPFLFVVTQKSLPLFAGIVNDLS